MQLLHTTKLYFCDLIFNLAMQGINKDSVENNVAIKIKTEQLCDKIWCLQGAYVDLSTALVTLSSSFSSRIFV